MKIKDNRMLTLAWHAVAAFYQARAVADLMMALKLTDNDARAAILYGAFVGYYSRPFMPSKELGSLPEGVVPKSSRSLHQRMLTDRKQIFLHTDANAEIPGITSVNHLRMVVLPTKQLRVHTVAPVPKAAVFQQYCDLLDLLYEDINSAIQLYIDDRMDEPLPGPGSYILNIEGDRLHRVPEE